MFGVSYNQFIDVIMIGYSSGPISHAIDAYMFYVKRVRFQGIRNVFPKQIRDFFNNFSVRNK